MNLRTWRGGSAAVLCCLMVAAGLRVDPTLQAQTRLRILGEARGTAVGLAVVLNAGSAWEMRSEAGLSHLAALATIEEVRPELEASGGRASVECGPTSIRFTLLLPPTGWQTAAGAFLDALFERPTGDEAIERARAALIGEGARQEGSFSSELSAELADARFGESSRWARAGCGRPGTLATLGADDVRRMKRARFTPMRAVIAIAGPVDRLAAADLVRRYLYDSDLPVLVPAPTPRPDGARRSIERSTVTAWTAIAFPFPAGTNVEALGLLAQRIVEAAAPGPVRPEVYDITTEIDRHGDGGALVVYLVTAPDHVERWAERVADLVRESAERALPDSAFEALRRRYAGRRLLELATPESRARDAAIQLFFDQDFEPPAVRIAALSPGRLRTAAAALGRPTVATLGASGRDRR